MSTVISVENLSKKYMIGHQKQERYTALRDVLTDGAKRFTHKLIHPFATPVTDPTHEEFWALKDVSFDIKQGDRLGIIGRNGAGKSTLLKILSRITEPTSGKISIKGRVASLLEVGTGFHPELSGRENIFLNGAILGMSKAEIKSKFDEIVAFAEVEKFLDTPVKRYSSGMYVRLAFAVAAHLEPEILIVDEVLAVGDAQFQKKCLGKMEDVSKEGRTILFVSHNIGAVSQLCDRVIVLDHGCCIADTTVEDGIQKYLSKSQSKISRVDYAECLDKGVQISHVSIRDIRNNEITLCKHSEEFQLVVEYRVRDWPVGAYVCVDVFNESDQRLIWSCDINSVDEMALKRQNGLHRATISMPAFVLTHGRYYFTFAIYDPGKRTVFELLDKAISIEIIDGDSILSSLGIKSNSLTSIPLKWTLQA